MEPHAWKNINITRTMSATTTRIRLVEDRYKASRGSMIPPQPPYRNYDKKANGTSSNNDGYLDNDGYGEDEDPEEQMGDDYLNNEEYAARGYPAVNSNEQNFANPCFNGYDIRNTYLRNNQSYIHDDDNAWLIPDIGWNMRDGSWDPDGSCVIDPGYRMDHAWWIMGSGWIMRDWSRISDGTCVTDHGIRMDHGWWILGAV